MSDYGKNIEENGIFSGILLLSDLDGTLLNEKKEIPPVNLEAIRYFQRQGGLFSIATGRCPMAARPIAEAAGVNCPAVTLNGAAIFDYAAGRVTVSRHLPPAFRTLAWAVSLRFPRVAIQVYEGSSVYEAVTNRITERLFAVEGVPRTMVTVEMLPSKGNKLLFGASHEELRDVREFLKTQDMSGMYGMFTEDCYYELLPSHTNKGEGARAVADSFGIPMERVAAMGDYYNDIDMLKAVGYPVTAANAPDDVRLLARYVAVDCNTGVVADTVRHLKERLRRFPARLL